MAGQPLDPLLAATAGAQAAAPSAPNTSASSAPSSTGCPAGWTLTTREQAEATLVRAAVGLDPDALRKAAERLLALIDQDGPIPDDAERPARRYLSSGRQGADGMTPAQGLLDPQARANVGGHHGQVGRPGHVQPRRHHPVHQGHPIQEQISGDTRTRRATPARRTDRDRTRVLSLRGLGQHNGLPVTIIVSTTLQELESAPAMRSPAAAPCCPCLT